MAIGIVGTTATIASSAGGAVTPAVVDGSADDTLVWLVDWGVDYTDSTYPTASDRPTLSGGVSAGVTHVLTQIGGVDFPTESWGEDTGKRFCSLFIAEATSATGADDAVTFTPTGSGTNRFVSTVCTRISKASGYGVNIAATGGEDTNKADAMSHTGFTDVGATVGDRLIAFVAYVPAATNPALTIGWPGCTLGTQSNIISGQYTGGYNVRMNVRTCEVTAGSSTGAPTLTSGATGGASAGIVFRLREVAAAPQPVGNVAAVRLTSTTASVSWTHPGDAPDGVSIARAPGTQVNDGGGRAPGDPGYDPLTISGATIVAQGLTGSPYTDTVPSAGIYTYWVARTSA